MMLSSGPDRVTAISIRKQADEIVSAHATFCFI